MVLQFSEFIADWEVSGLEFLKYVCEGRIQRFAEEYESRQRISWDCKFMPKWKMWLVWLLRFLPKIIVLHSYFSFLFIYIAF